MKKVSGDVQNLGLVTVIHMILPQPFDFCKLCLAIGITALLAISLTNYAESTEISAPKNAPVIADWTVPMGKTTDHELVVNSTHRTYRLHVPPIHVPGCRLPLIVDLHGAGMTGALMEFYSHLSEIADREGFIVAYPDGGIGPKDAPTKKPTWMFRLNNADDDVVFISALLDELEKNPLVDTHHIMLAGGSAGGCMSYRAGISLAPRLNAIGVVCGTMTFDISDGEPLPPPTPCSSLSIIAIHGRQDAAIPYEGADRNITRFWSIEHTISFWTAHNACTESSLRTFKGFTYALWKSASNQTEVELITVDPAGHNLDNIPAFETYLALWEFLVRDRPCRLSPIQKYFFGEVTVSFPLARTPIPNSTLHYTIDGSAPTSDSPLCSGPITLTQSATVRVSAFVGDQRCAGETATTYWGLTLRPPNNPQKINPGLRWTYYEGEWDRVPDSAQVQGVATGVCLVPDLSPRKRDHQFALIFSGFFVIPKDGFYTISTRSDDGSVIDIDDVRVVNNDGLHPVESANGKAMLAAGLHPIRIGYFEETGASEFSLSIQAENQPPRPMEASDFVYE